MLKGFLENHKKKDAISFHMPGHKGSDLYRRFGYEGFLNGFMDWDVTEIPGADNLFQAESVIKEVEEAYAKLYGVRKSYLLINGTSSGLIASILATVPRGGKLIMARNCHKSVFNALWLGDIEPVYLKPMRGPVAGAISKEEVEEVLSKNKDASVVVLPSPNYYGICSDIDEIAEVVHAEGKILIVDQAHGAHLKFFNEYTENILEMPKAAENSHSDIVVNSTHKTLASMTQSAILNVNSNKIDIERLEDKLQGIQSTSPSYVLMSSLDINCQILSMHGKALMEEWAENLKWFYEEAKKIPLLIIPRWENLDHSKINIDMGISGRVLEEKLIEHNIYTELHTGNLLMAMSGIGNRRGDFEKLLESLEHISSEIRKEKKSHCKGGNKVEIAIGNSHEKKIKGVATEEEIGKKLDRSTEEIAPIPREVMKIHLKEAKGYVCAKSIVPYPPGIPQVCPGEKITETDIEYLLSLREAKEKVLGIDKDGRVAVGKPTFPPR